ncbi:hypothetical protein D8B26_002244 [Coccidioides posadasii str. Silveira]|uniref:uncharacterized protein n=1 Tax=Coccidioides posadasii (strain RMSCC 757 / Silveira) TaxID=443226 RepID=UPI001BEEDBBC|nr:hypothetical protein D8B26_002244 [Coccidioides posadasii str. Silveira]
MRKADHDVEGRKVSAEIGGEAQIATVAETSMDFRTAIKLYPKAAAWSLFFSLGVIMTGFDPQIMGNLYGVPKFQEDFGYIFKGKWIISAAWQSGLRFVTGGIGPSSNTIIDGRLAWEARLVKSWTCVVLTAGCVFIQFYARSLPVLLVGELLGGLILGCYAVIAPAYASEVCPVALRGVLAAYINLCFVIGQFIGNGIAAATHGLDSHWAYSIPFSMQWIWPAIILLGIFFAPESPWWLVRKGRLDNAEMSLRRLASPRVDVKATLAMIIETDRLEQEMEAGTTYRDCFRKINLRRTEIAIGVYTIQVFSGIYLIGFSTYFFTLAGLSTDNAFNMGIGFLGVGFVGTCLSWVLLSYFGRRTIYGNGLGVMAIILFIIGILDCTPNYLDRPGVIWAQSSMMLVWNFTYNISVGPICFVILCECSATKVRSKTIAIATAIQAIFGIVMTVAIPHMINPDAGNMRGKLGFFFGGLSIICLLWTWFRVPETKGRTYEELDIMFERNVPTHQFKDYKVI